MQILYCKYVNIILQICRYQAVLFLIFNLVRLMCKSTSSPSAISVVKDSARRPRVPVLDKVTSNNN